MFIGRVNLTRPIFLLSNQFSSIGRMKKILLISITAVFSFQFSTDSQLVITNKIAADSLKTVTISFVGDLMCHSPEINFAKVGRDTFDFKPMFREVKKFLSVADLTIGNLETTISGKNKKFSGYPLFNSPDEFIYSLKDAGFDVLLTANNHSLDRGKEGIIRTLEKIREFGLNSIGSYKSQQDRDSIRIFEINGIKLALLAYTYGLNGNYLPKGEKYLVNVIDTVSIRKDIQNARSKNAEIIVVYFHFGNEYSHKPSDYQKIIVQRIIDYGANIIIGSHPHVVQPIEIFSSSKNKINKGVIAYSLGNFISNQRWRYSDAGVILNLKLTKNIFKDNVQISDISILPTWVFKGKTDRAEGFVILPADTSILKPIPYYLTKSDKEKLLQANDDTRKMFDKNPSIRYLR